MMANINLAQYESYLKSIVTTLKQIGLLHQQMHDALSDATTDTQEAISILNVSWSKVVDLFVVLDGLRQSLQETNDD